MVAVNGGIVILCLGGRLSFGGGAVDIVLFRATPTTPKKGAKVAVIASHDFSSKRC